MRNRWALSILILILAGCADDTSLQGVFERQMKEDGAANFTVLHIDERANDGIVLFTSAGEAALFYFAKADQGWTRQTGTNCGANGIARVGLMGNGYAYCATLKADMDFAVIRVGSADATLLETEEGRRVWFVRADDGSQDVVGVKDDDSEFTLN